jgi:hypothetical protein
MRFLLGVLAVVLNLLDNTTTFLCLRAPVNGFEVFEANPVARWIFDAVGLFEGLMIETVITTAAIAFLVLTSRIPRNARLALLLVLALLPAWAVANNLQVIYDVGLEIPGI